MKKFLVVFFTVVFMAVMISFTGCGGGGTKVNSAADEEGQVMDEASQKSREELPTTYLVETGDSLATIAEKAEIYGNKYQWPLIFDANKDILDDYKTIQEGQKLIIPRNVSAVEIEAAKQRAEELNWPASEGRTASRGDEAEEETGEEGSVAGISSGKISGQTGSESASVEETTGAEGTEMGTEEQPTPIPEPGKKAKKKGGPNVMLLLLILIGVAAVIFWFMMSQKKKKDDEEDKEDKSDNILG